MSVSSATCSVTLLQSPQETLIHLHMGRLDCDFRKVLAMACSFFVAHCAKQVCLSFCFVVLIVLFLSPAATLTALKKLLVQWGALLKKFLTGEEDEVRACSLQPRFSRTAIGTLRCF